MTRICSLINQSNLKVLLCVEKGHLRASNYFLSANASLKECGLSVSDIFYTQSQT